MKFILSFILVILFSLNVYAQEKAVENNDLPKDFNIMYVVCFLNAQMSADNESSCEADKEKKAFRCFNEDGQLIRERYLDENNDCVEQKYDTEGKVISEIRLTEESIKNMLKRRNEKLREKKDEKGKKK